MNKYGTTQAKSVSTPLSSHFKLSKTHEPKIEEEERKTHEIPYANTVGSIMYSLVCNRPDVAYVLSIVSRFMVKPCTTQWQVIKWLMRYIRESFNKEIAYRKHIKHEDQLVAFVDSDYAGCLDSRKSIFGYAFTLYGGVVSWKNCL